VSCEVCGRTAAFTTCEPLLVSGEVIGAVLASHEQPLTPTDDHTIKQSVAQAAPVLGNLRNLAIAEMRAATDALTGLPNNRNVTDTVKRMVAQTARTVASLSALSLDLDHFKQINDSYGHGIGDEVLATVASALVGAVRESDFVGRAGGEEFVILLPDTPLQQAELAAEKLRAAVESIAIAAVERPITASIGIAVVPDHAGDAGTLLRHADRALYAAKRNGRNRTEVFTPGMLPGETPATDPPVPADGARRSRARGRSPASRATRTADR
jgi:diguanylate cyclase (GGDEF)-like protein